jgi:serine/threonine-protein kinase
VPVAEGATAQVWAARRAGAGAENLVAIKAMLTDLSADVDAESMFLDEARLVSRIRHPNIAAVLDQGEHAEAIYIVVEWVEGEPLQVVLREARTGVPLPLALRIVERAASGLHAAHELRDDTGQPLGLVHRDVSPQNILVGYDGTVKVIDFGIAKAAANMQRTRMGQIKGKVPYMAPEQASGERVDRRTDVFALGVVLYQLVTGKHPFRGESEFATLARIRDQDPAPPPRSLVPNLPPALDAVMLKALAKDRDDRFSDMLEFQRGLEQAVPPAPDVDRSLGEFTRSLLSHRAARRQEAIRRALDVIAERVGYDGGDPHTPAQGWHDGGGHPADLDTGPDGGHPHATGPDEGHPNAPGHEPGRASGIRRLGGLVDPHGHASDRAASGASARGPSPPAGPSHDGPVDLPEGMRPRRSQRTIIVAGVVLVLVLLLAILAAATASSGGGDSSPTKRAF